MTGSWRWVGIHSDLPLFRRPSGSPSIIELGAGTWLPGLVAAKVDSDVTLTDDANRPEVLSNMRRVSDLNLNCNVMGLTWNMWDADIFGIHPIIILGADVLYDTSAFDDLFATVAFLLQNSPGSVFMTTYHNRRSFVFGEVSKAWSEENTSYIVRRPAVHMLLKIFQSEAAIVETSVLTSNGLSLIITLPDDSILMRNPGDFKGIELSKVDQYPPSTAVQSCSLYSILNEQSDTAVDLDCPLKGPRHETIVVGCCDGLVCIAAGKEVCIWNPSTLPNVDMGYLFYRYGFGYDESIDDYKVVGFFCNVRASDVVVKVKVYTSKTDSWKSIVDSSDSIPRNHSVIYVKGALHWAPWGESHQELRMRCDSQELDRFYCSLGGVKTCAGSML
ncbi:hypothetical protein RHMOL_Rhmol02G0061000 [Rhododendron molle]|uniref:Uncharacterized protein n=1 Tax=Rhododendron molle TaxID=49168 RepID=A0ACC0PM44_RHOML|nr:hypothetical protein RHMOL_Rhmol02G0061000 [Rhododendron molle]